MSHSGYAIYKIIPNTNKLLKHMKKDFKESTNINCNPSKETSLHYYKELQIKNSPQENYWNTENIDDGAIKMEVLK